VKPGFTPDEHADMGAMLAAIHDELLHREVTTSKAYPKSSRAVSKLRSAANAVLIARAVLDDAMATEHPEEFSPTVYFPDPEDRLTLRAVAEEPTP
jgi:hypothetical protein